MRYLLLWMVWLASTMAWACLCLSLFLGRTTPLMLSRWWLLGLAIVLTFSLAIRLSFLVYLRRAMGNTGTVFAAQSRAALTDIPFAATLPLLALVNLSDSMNHYLSSIPLLQCTVLLAPIVAAAVVHEALLNRLAPHSDSALSKDPVLAPRSRAIMQESLAVMLLVGLALLFFWPTFTGRVPIPVDLNYHVPPWNSLVDSLPSVNNPVPSDALWLAYPYAHFRYQSADSSLVPLWNPHTFAGAPYLAEPNTQALQPLHFLFTRLLPATALTVITVLYFALAGIGMYAFIRTIRLPRGAALLGAITFMFGSFVSMWLQLTYLMASIAWLLPLTLLGMELILRGKYRWGSLVAGSSLGVALFGSPQLAIYIVMAGVLYTTWMMIAQWIQGDQSPRRLFTRAVIVAGSALLALGIAAAQIIPSLELTQLSQRAASSSAIAANSLPTPQLLTILLPGIMGYPPDNTTWGGSNLLEATLYVGILPLLLASWATWTCNNRYLIFGVGLTALSILSVLDWPPVHLLLAVFPPFRLFPYLGRIVLLSQFGIALLTAYGAVSLLRHRRHCPNRLLRSSVIAALLLLAVAAVTFATQQWPDPTEAAFHRATTALRDSSRWLASIALLSCGALVLIFRYGKTIPMGKYAIAGLVIVFDLTGFAAPLYTYSPPKAIFPTTPVITYLQHQQADHQFRTTSLPFPTLLPNAAIVYGLDDARGYSSLYPLRIWQFASLVNGDDPLAMHTNVKIQRLVNHDLHDLRLLSLLNVEYILLEKGYQPTPPLDLSELDYVMESPGPRGVTLYRNPGVLPRAFLVGNAETVADAAEAAMRLQDPQFDPAQQVVLEHTTALPSFAMPQTSSVDIVSYEPERVRIHVDTDGPAWLLLTDTYYPGWQATINGEEAPIYAADLLFRAVAIPPGSSTVEFTYQPASWRWGVRISLAALFIWLIILLYPLRNRFKTQRVHGKPAGLPAGSR